MWAIIQGDARRIPLGDETVQCVVTSPPFWGLRNYGLPPSVWGGKKHEHEWGKETIKDSSPQSGLPYAGAHSPEGMKVTLEKRSFSASQGFFCPCGAWLGVLGLEPDPNLYIDHMVEIFREVRRVLRKDGTVWMNLGDSYNGSWGNYGPTSFGGQREKSTERWTRWAYDNHKGWRPPTSNKNNLKPKDLCGIPWRVALALQADGWWLRSEITLCKDNPMPESVTDRPVSATEKMFLLTKSSKYFYDNEAVREPQTGNAHSRGNEKGNDAYQEARGSYFGWKSPSVEVQGGRNLRNWWRVVSEPFPDAHFATFGTKWIEPCIKAGTSEKGCCAECGSPWERVVEKDSKQGPERQGDASEMTAGPMARLTKDGISHSQFEKIRMGDSGSTTLGWQPSCIHCQVCDSLGLSTKEGEIAHAAQRSRTREGMAKGLEQETMDDKHGTSQKESRTAAEISESLRQVQDRIPGQKFEPILFPDVLNEMDVGEAPGEQISTRGQGQVQSEICKRENTISSSVDYSRASGQRIVANREGPPYQRGQGGQSDRQFNSYDDETTCTASHEAAQHELTPYPVVPCVCLDPFAGSGTVGVVCLALNRSFVGIELKPDYCDMANKRVFNSGSLLDYDVSRETSLY